jgi:hypothetical protein
MTTFDKKLWAKNYYLNKGNHADIISCISSEVNNG